ncbi:MAG TPA: ribbon-helix-helix domain-containing protein [Polyangiaceae bacterium]
MSRKKISTTVYITQEQNDRLHLLHSRTKVPVSVYIREGIDLVLKHYEHELPGQMSLVDAVAKAQVPLPGAASKK